jgi:hypothetical protein
MTIWHGSAAAAAAANNNSKKETKTGDSSGFGKGRKEELMKLRREVAEYEVEFRSLRIRDVGAKLEKNASREHQAAGGRRTQRSGGKGQTRIARNRGTPLLWKRWNEAAMEPRGVQTLGYNSRPKRSRRRSRYHSGALVLRS